jgi:hypothetical protein
VKHFFQLIFIASLVLLAGCGFRVDETNVPAKLSLLETHFGVQWPTNCIKQYGGSLSAPLLCSTLLFRRSRGHEAHYLIPNLK